MKKRYNVNLDMDETDRLKKLLVKIGISFSAFVNGHVRSTLSGGVLQPRKGEELYLVLASTGHRTRKRSAKGTGSGTFPGLP